MTDKYIQTTLGSIAKGSLGLVDGPFGSNLPASEYRENGIPIIRGSNLTVGTARFRAAEFVFVSNQTAERLSRSLCRPLDIIFTKKGTLGQTGIIPQDGPYSSYLLSSNQMRLTVDPEVADPKFVYYVVSSSESTEKIIRDSEATGVPKTNLAYLREFPIVLPPLAEQRAIARILGALDDKIELNLRMNETLEAIARTLFKSWFADFDPVHAKAEGRDPSLPEPIADLFPARLVDSELGEIPEDWRVSDLRSVTAYLNRGISPAYLENGGVLVMNQKCVREGRVDPSKGRRHNPEARSVDGRLLKKGDILVNSTGVGTLGRVAQVLSPPEDTIVDSHVTVVRADEGTVSWNYLGIWLRDREQEIEALGEGSTGQTELSRSRLGELSILVPPLQMMLAFDEASLPIRERSTASEKESQVLAAIRDALLPKLISGELRLKDAEQVVAEAAQ